MIASGCSTGQVRIVTKEKFYFHEIQSVASPANMFLSGNLRICLVGIKDPRKSLFEKNPLYDESLKQLRKFLKKRKVIIENASYKKDITGAWPVYIYFLYSDPAQQKYLTKELLNAYILEQGWAIYRPLKEGAPHRQELINAEADARASGRGIWRD